MDLFSVSLFGTAALLIYSAVKGFNPVDVVKYGLGGDAPVTFADQNKGVPQSDPPLHDKVTPLDPNAPDVPDPLSDPGIGSPLTFHPTTDPPPRVTGT